MQWRTPPDRLPQPDSSNALPNLGLKNVRLAENRQAIRFGMDSAHAAEIPLSLALAPRMRWRLSRLESGPGAALYDTIEEAIRFTSYQFGCRQAAPVLTANEDSSDSSTDAGGRPEGLTLALTTPLMFGAMASVVGLTESQPVPVLVTAVAFTGCGTVWWGS